MNTEETATIKRVALMLAAAYWRGRYSTGIYGTKLRDIESEPLISAAANRDMGEWMASARYAVTQSSVVCPTEVPKADSNLSSAEQAEEMLR